MPLHEYECDVCGRRFEKIQKFSDPPIEVCPTCGGHVHKLISSPAFTFKGSGFYATDYAKKESSPGDKSKTDGDSKSEAASTKEAGGSAKDGGDKKDGGEKKSDSSSTSTSTPSESSTTKTTTKEQS
jgi:putative FmdB family regulatory protein